MKKFAKILICLILCVFAFGVAGCRKKDNYVYPSANDTTYSNGGLAVQKGNYIYFVNGYQSANDTKQNKDYVVGSLMVAKLDAKGNPILDENGLLNDDYYRTISSKLCGFEATNLYIFGDYLYFTSQHQQNEPDRNGGEWAKTRVDFSRIKLDKSGKVEKLYTSEVGYDNLKFAYYNYNSNTYLLAYEGGDSIDTKNDDTNRLLSVNASSKKEKTIAKDVVDVLMPDENVKNAHENIFYTTKDSETGKSVLTRYNIINNEKKEHKFNEEITLKFVTNGYVFYTVSQAYGGGTNLCYSTTNGDVSSEIEYEFGKNIQTKDKYYLSADGDAIIAITGNKIEIDYKWNKTHGGPVTIDDADGFNFIGFSNCSVVYYDSNNYVKTIDYTSNQENVEIVKIAKVEDMNKTYFDCNEDYLYFYKTSGANNYLFRLRLNNNAEMVADEMVGVYLDADKPKAEDEE